MLFSSITFLYFFLPITLGLYVLVPKRCKNYVLLLASLFFYGAGEPKYIVLLVFSAVVGWLHGLAMEKYPGKRWLLVSAVFWNLAFLLFFKYTDFLIHSVNDLLHSSIPVLGIALPIGISFFTFQNMSYVIDVYRGDYKAARSFFNYATYLCLFPQLIAGPIVRYSDVEYDLLHRRHTAENISYGVLRFAVGLGKKVLLANAAGQLADMTLPQGSVVFSWMRAVALPCRSTLTLPVTPIWASALAP